MKDFNFKVLTHSAIKLIENKIIYIDPYNLYEEYHDADYIFCTHSHYDHYSKQDIEKVMKKDTKFVVTKDIEQEINELVESGRLLIVRPNKKYCFGDLEFNTTYSYNLDKQFHTKDKKWVGYIIYLDGIKYYIAGDTDNIKEIQDVKCDIAFVPVGGIYTMDNREAAELINKIKPKIAVPTHYGRVVGTKEDAIKFSKLVDRSIEVRF